VTPIVGRLQRNNIIQTERRRARWTRAAIRRHYSRHRRISQAHLSQSV